MTMPVGVDTTQHPFFEADVEAFLGQETRITTQPLRPLHWAQVIGGVLVLAGLVAEIAGWWGVSSTTETYRQLSFFISGGIGGASLMGLGATVFLSYEHREDRRALGRLDERMQALEHELRAETDGLGAGR